MITGPYLYAVGGRDDNCRILNTAEKYDPFTNTWHPIASMEHARVGFGLVAVDDNIYALGGSNDMTDPLTSVEMYNVFTNQWKPVPQMCLKRVWSCYAVVDKKIYVLAGGSIGKLYEAVECFNTRTQTWSAVSPLRERRCDARACSVGSDIYVFGGFRRIECPSAAHGGHSVKFCATECYSTRHDTWTQINSRGPGPGLCTMTDTSQISGAVCDSNDEDVYVIGGLDVHTGMHCVRAFNLYTNTWRAVVLNSPAQSLRGSTCVMLRVPLYTLNSLQAEHETDNSSNQTSVHNSHLTASIINDT